MRHSERDHTSGQMSTIFTPTPARGVRFLLLYTWAGSVERSGGGGNGRSCSSRPSHSPSWRQVIKKRGQGGLKKERWHCVAAWFSGVLNEPYLE